MDSCGCAVQADGDSPSRNGCKRKNPAKDAVSPRLLLGFICGEERCSILKQSKAARFIIFYKHIYANTAMSQLQEAKKRLSTWTDFSALRGFKARRSLSILAEK